MPEHIIIEFDADLSGLKPAIDALHAIGLIDKKVADEFKRNNAAFAERQKVMRESAATSKTASIGIEELSKRYRELTTSLPQRALEQTANELVEIDSKSRQASTSLGQLGSEGAASVAELEAAFEKVGAVIGTKLQSVLTPQQLDAVSAEVQELFLGIEAGAVSSDRALQVLSATITNQLQQALSPDDALEMALAIRNDLAGALGVATQEASTYATTWTRAADTSEEGTRRSISAVTNLRDDISRLKDEALGFKLLGDTTGFERAQAEAAALQAKLEETAAALGGVALAGSDSALEMTAGFKQLVVEIARARDTALQFKIDGDQAGFEKWTTEANALQAELDTVTKSFEGFGQVTQKTNGATDQAAVKSETLKKRLRELKEQMAQLAVQGKANTAEFAAMANEAGQIEDTIGDVSSRVKALASDTSKIDAFTQGVTGIAGGFAAAQGAVALFGGENEELQETLVRVQSSLAILNGLQAVFAAVNKDSALAVQTLGVRQAFYNFVMTGSVKGTRDAVVSTAALAAAHRGNAVATAQGATATAAMGTAQKGAAVATTFTAGAMRVLRVALIGLGIGAIVVLIAALVANFDRIKAAVLNVVPGLGNLGAKFNEFKVVAMGALSVVFEAVKQIATGLFQIATGDLFGVIDTVKNFGTNIAKAKAEGERGETQRQLKAAADEETALRIDSNNRVLAVMEASGKDTSALRKKIIQDELSLLKQGTDEEKKAYRDKANELLVLDAEIAKERSDNAKEAAEKTAQEARDRAERLKKIQEEVANARNEVKLAALPQDEREVEQLRQKYAAMKSETEAFGAVTEVEKQAQADALLAIEETYQAELAALRAKQFATTSTNEYQASLKAVEDYYAQRARIEKKRFADGEIDEVTYNQRLAELTVEMFEGKKSVALDYTETVTTAADDALTFEEQAADKSVDILISTNARKKAENDRAEAERLAQLARIVAYEANLKEQGMEITRNISDIGLNWEINALQKALDRKKISQDQYDKRIREAQQRAAIRQKGMNAASVIADTAASIVKTGKELGYPAAIPFQVLAAAVGATQLGKVLTTPLPTGYYDGTEYLQRNGAAIGRDTIPIRAHEGERIVPHYINNQLKGIPNKALPALAKIYWHNHQMPDFASIVVPKAASREPQVNVNIDHAQLAKEIGDEIKQHPRMVNNVDKQGFTTFIEQNGHRKEILNKRYKLNG
ncbi:MAG TPA: hypothetical protein VEY71_00910 [Chitinophagales bacterium]|nr:hypothetical protein [Chitinophagales bacterium]